MTDCDTLYDAFEMSDSDVSALEASIFEQLRTAWLARITELARQHGIRNPNPTLQGADLEALHKKAHEDALSVVDTYNRELRNQVDGLCEDNPDEDVSFYVGRLDSWLSRRNERKSLEIGLNSVTAMVAYAMTRFIAMNGLESERYRAVGAVPVCPICIDIVAAGEVDYEYTQMNPLPAHYGCSHSYELVNPQIYDDSETNVVIWMGQ